MSVKTNHAEELKRRDADLAALRGALAERDGQILALEQRLSRNDFLSRAGSVQDAGDSGRALRLSGVDFLSELENRPLAPSAVDYAASPRSPEDAFSAAKHGELPLFSPRPYEPDATMHTLSAVMQLTARVQKLDRMIRFLVERA
jgi:hypothetical protein